MLCAGIAALGCAVDLWSKHRVFSLLGYPHGISDWEWDVPGLIRLRLHTTFNEGALWGLGQGFSLGFAALSIAAVAGIAYWLWFGQASRSLWLTVALGWITAGTLGNFYDRVGWHACVNQETGRRYFAVRDFLDARLFDVYDWPVFNIADVCLVTGAILLMLHALLFDPPTADPNKSADTASRGTAKSAEPAKAF